eukprot:jgi/Hompol1/5297/HPOL_000936-RA
MHRACGNAFAAAPSTVHARAHSRRKAAAAAAAAVGPIIKDEPGISVDLSSLDLRDIVSQREKLVYSLHREQNKLKWANDDGSNNASIILIDARLNRLKMLEDILRSSLDVYTEILKNQNISNMDALMESENTLIIDKFQKLVLQAKNDLKAGEVSRKTTQAHEEKLRKEQKAAAAAGSGTDENSTNHSSVNSDGSGSNASGASGSGSGSSGSSGGGGGGVVDNVLKDVADKADQLESNLNDDAFSEHQGSKDTTLETVLKVDGKTSNSTAKSQAEKPAPVLIDSKNNQYVLSKSGDATAHVEDSQLMSDILLLLLTCFACVTIFHVLSMPSFFGYILAGVLLGPPGYIKNAVQVETISRGLGVVFIMFFLGLEFNISKIKKVWSVSIFGSMLLMTFTVLAVVAAGLRLGFKSTEAIMVGACLFLSSTAVVLNFMKAGEMETLYGRTIMGILIAQDVILGILLVLMPALESSSSDPVYEALRLIGLLIAFLLTCFAICIPATKLLHWLLPVRGYGQEIYMLASIGFCLLIVDLGSLFGQSLELCCFVAGVMISSRKVLSDATIHVAEPLRGMFSALFFASIGLHIYPSFLLNEGILLVLLTAVVVLCKIVCAMLVLRIVFSYSWTNSLTVAIGLGQISEFTFVLASKAKSLELLSREIFYLLLGVTTLSMFISPLLWHATSFLDGRSKQESYKRLKSSLSDHLDSSEL